MTHGWMDKIKLLSLANLLLALESGRVMAEDRALVL